MARGTVSRLVVERGFGFISPTERDSPDVWFHVSRVEDMEFDELLKGRRVEYEMFITPKGPAARWVRPVD